MNWHIIKRETPPIIGERYIILIESVRIAIGKWDGREFYFSKNGKKSTVKNVTHWMYFPIVESDDSHGDIKNDIPIEVLFRYMKADYHKMKGQHEHLLYEATTKNKRLDEMKAENAYLKEKLSEYKHKLKEKEAQRKSDIDGMNKEIDRLNNIIARII